MFGQRTPNVDKHIVIRLLYEISCLFSCLSRFYVDRVFLIFNNTLPLPRIIYSSDKFQELSGYSRHEVMQFNCRVAFLHGPKTDLSRIAEIENGVQVAEELQVEVWLYKKDGKPN